MLRRLVPLLLTVIPKRAIVWSLKKLISGRVRPYLPQGEPMVKGILVALADLFDAWADGSNDPGDLRHVSDAVADAVEGEFDDELDSFLSKPFVGTALGFLSSVLRKLGD